MRSTRRRKMSFSEMKRRFSEENIEDKVEDVIDEVEQSEGEGIETAEDIAVLVMALDAEKVAKSEDAQKLLGEITGLPEEGVDMIMEIKTSLEEGEDKEEEKENFSRLVRGVKRASRKFSRKFSKRRKFNEEDLELISEVMEEEEYPGMEESVEHLTGLGHDVVATTFSRARRRMSRRTMLKRRAREFSVHRRNEVMNRRSFNRSSLESERTPLVRSRRSFSRSSLIPTRKESMGFRKIENDRNRVRTVRPKDPMDMNAGYDGKRFSREQATGSLDFLRRIAGK